MSAPTGMQIAKAIDRVWRPLRARAWPRPPIGTDDHLYTTLYEEDFGAKLAAHLRDESDEVAAYVTDHPAPVRSDDPRGPPPTIGRS